MNQVAEWQGVPDLAAMKAALEAVPSAGDGASLLDDCLDSDTVDKITNLLVRKQRKMAARLLRRLSRSDAAKDLNMAAVQCSLDGVRGQWDVNQGR